LQAEEEANRLVEELRRLKIETESYKTAREALGQAATGVGDLSSRCATIIEQIGGIAETLRSIGTPELLSRMEVVADQVGVLRQRMEDFQQAIVEAHQQDIDSMQHSILEAHQREIERIKEDLGEQLADVRAALRFVRNLAVGGVLLLAVALTVLSWLVVSLVRS
jgi:chromosome segregation ATPase